MEDKYLTIPNALSVYRFLSALFIFASLYFDINLWIVFVVYVIAVATDKLDGILARKLNQESKIGEMLETATDTIFTGVTIAYIIIKFDFPVIIFMGLLCLFVLSAINATIYLAFKKEFYSRSLIISKVSVIVTYLGCGLYFFDLPIKVYIGPVMLIVASLAFVVYEYNLIKDLKIKKPNETISSNPGL